MRRDSPSTNKSLGLSEYNPIQSQTPYLENSPEETKDDVRKVQAFINSGADVNQFDDQGLTMLHRVVKAGHVESLKLLLKHPNIDANLKSTKEIQSKNVYNYCMTAVMIALEYKHKEVLEILCNHEKIELNTEQSLGAPPLLYAVINNRIESVKILLKNTNIDINNKINTSATALHVAIVRGCNDIVSILLDDHRTIIMQQTEDGRTPLYLAATRSNRYIVNEILEHPRIDLNKEFMINPKILEVVPTILQRPDFDVTLLPIEKYRVSDTTYSKLLEIISIIVQVLRDFKKNLPADHSIAEFIEDKMDKLGTNPETRYKKAKVSNETMSFEYKKLIVNFLKTQLYAGHASIDGEEQYYKRIKYLTDVVKAIKYFDPAHDFVQSIMQVHLFDHSRFIKFTYEYLAAISGFDLEPIISEIVNFLKEDMKDEERHIVMNGLLKHVQNTLLKTMSAQPDSNIEKYNKNIINIYVELYKTLYPSDKTIDAALLDNNDVVARLNSWSNHRQFTVEEVENPSNVTENDIVPKSFDDATVELMAQDTSSAI